MHDPRRRNILLLNIHPKYRHLGICRTCTGCSTGSVSAAYRSDGSYTNGEGTTSPTTLKGPWRAQKFGNLRRERRTAVVLCGASRVVGGFEANNSRQLSGLETSYSIRSGHRGYGQERNDRASVPSGGVNGRSVRQREQHGHVLSA